jgi:hypothetical protein
MPLNRDWTEFQCPSIHIELRKMNCLTLLEEEKKNMQLEKHQHYSFSLQAFERMHNCIRNATNFNYCILNEQWEREKSFNDIHTLQKWSYLILQNFLYDLHQILWQYCTASFVVFSRSFRVRCEAAELIALSILRNISLDLLKLTWNGNLPFVSLALEAVFFSELKSPFMINLHQKNFPNPFQSVL